ncbi:MAG: aminoacetone oxidase family FAD-binding enzyme [Clostridia bacterium]|nr:aminoacetone oxidase family FAD-binding enzyme [Clostridia bacterium]
MENKVKEHFKVAVVGGGAAGLTLAAELVRKGVKGGDILVLERNDRVGKKLLVTGNGQCNLSNENMRPEFYHGDAAVISSFLEGLKTFDLKEFFYSLGVPLKADGEGRIYPLSKQAGAVLDAFRFFLTENSVEIVTGAKVLSAEKKDGVFRLVSEKGEFSADKVAFAFGGAAGKRFGTDGTSYSLAESFGHSVTSLYPSLVQIKTETQKIRGLKGLKEDVRITASDGERAIRTETGELLFTDYGVSGSVVFKISGYLAGLSDPRINIEFLPDFTRKEIEKIINDKLRLDFINKKEILSGLLNKMVGAAVVKTAKALSAPEIAKAVKNFCLKVTGNTGFNNAQVTKGGINGGEIRPETFESKLCDGLYIVGESLDVDGDCGGYNLTFAFYCGHTAAEDIAKRVK